MGYQNFNKFLSPCSVQVNLYGRVRFIQIIRYHMVGTVKKFCHLYGRWPLARSLRTSDTHFGYSSCLWLELFVKPYDICHNPWSQLPRPWALAFSLEGPSPNFQGPWALGPSLKGLGHTVLCIIYMP